MNYINRYINKMVLTAVVMSAVACSDLLDENPVSNRTTESYYVDQQGFNDLVASAYSSLREVHKERTLMLSGTDIFTRPGDPDVGNLNNLNEYAPQGIHSQTEVVNTLWDVLYKAIGRTNTAISRASRVEMDEDEKAVRVGEAKFLRALYYFYLVQQYGAVPLVVEEITSVVTTAERTPEADVYAQIIRDLEDAVDVLPAEPDNYGRATEGAARHLLAKVYLTRGYRDFGSADDFTKAANHAKTVIDAPQYRLLDTFAEVFAQGNDVNDEIIFSVQYSNNLATNGDGNNAHSIFGQGVDALVGMDRSSTYNRQQPHFVPTRFLNTLYDPDIDSRYDATFLRVFYATVNQGSVSVGDTVLYFPRWDEPWSEEKIASKPFIVVNLDEYYMNPSKDNQFPPIWKFFEANLPYGDDQGRRDLFVFRLAETYLIAAEAYLKAGDPDAALEQINEVRRRAAKPGMEADMELTSVTIDDILDERARELAGEDQRWTDLKRTGKLIERVKLHNELAAAANHIANKHTLRPIPLSQIERTTNKLSQNEGY